MDDNRQTEQLDKVSGWIKDMGGEVVEVQRWGKRRLSYEINRKRDGIYTHIIHKSPGPVVKELERRMRLDETVMRILSVLHVPIELTQPQATPEALAAAAEEGDE
jgi:small subunit ribosomal protein S6